MSFFIVFEGIDGSGKTTITQKLFESLLNNNQNTVLFQEPTKFASGLRLREYLSGNLQLTTMEELELFLEDRRQSVEKNILPALRSGKHIILDRYYYSTAAYQANLKRSPESILEMNQKEGFPSPDYLVYMDVDIAIALERIEKERKGKDIFETKEKLSVIKSNYEKILPEDCIRIHADQKVEDILAEIFQAIPF